MLRLRVRIRKGAELQLYPARVVQKIAQGCVPCYPGVPFAPCRALVFDFHSPDPRKCVRRFQIYPSNFE